ncbi:hypothetical protein BKA93DRAFT_166156 [Sparassis latifolia]
MYHHQGVTTPTPPSDHRRTLCMMHKIPPSISVDPPSLIHPGRVLTYTTPPRTESVSSTRVEFGRRASNSRWATPPRRNQEIKIRSPCRMGAQGLRRDAGVTYKQRRTSCAGAEYWRILRACSTGGRANISGAGEHAKVWVGTTSITALIPCPVRMTSRLYAQASPSVDLQVRTLRAQRSAGGRTAPARAWIPGSDLVHVCFCHLCLKFLVRARGTATSRHPCTHPTRNRRLQKLQVSTICTTRSRRVVATRIHPSPSQPCVPHRSGRPIIPK